MMTTSTPANNLDDLLGCNWHVHTSLSSCGKEEMTPRAIVSAAESAGLETIALTDHNHWLDDDLPGRMAEVESQLSAVTSPVRVIVGAELSAFGVGRYADAPEVNAQVGYRLYACNHYHLRHWEHPKDRTPRGYAEHMLAVLRELLPTGRADCIAHPFSCPGSIPDALGGPSAAARAVSDAELGEILELGRINGVAWEINARSCLADPALASRLWRLGREVGVEFRFGTDAHRLAHVDPAPFLPKLAEVLSQRISGPSD